MIDYKKELIKMLNDLDDEKFLNYLYVLVKEMIAKNFSNNTRVG